VKPWPPPARLPEPLSLRSSRQAVERRTCGYPASDHATDDPELAVRVLAQRLPTKTPKRSPIEEAIDRKPSNFDDQRPTARSSPRLQGGSRHDSGQSQLRDGQITVRDFIGPFCLSDTFTRVFTTSTATTGWARHLVEEEIAGPAGVTQAEEIAWSAVHHDQGRSPAPFDQILSSQETSRKLWATTRSLPRNRVGRVPRGGETPFNITTPRFYDAYHRGVLGLPQVIYTGTVRSLPHGKATPWWLPRDYLALGSQACALRTGRGGLRQLRHCDFTPSKVAYRRFGGMDASFCSLSQFHHWLHGGSFTTPFLCPDTGLASVVADAPCPPAVCTDLLQQSEEEVRELGDSDSGPDIAARMT